MSPFEINHPSAVFMALAVVFVALNAFFVAAEFALVKIRHTRLEILAKKGNRIARLALTMSHNLDPYLGATQLGITLASLGLGWVGEPAFARFFEAGFKQWSFSISEGTIHSLAFTMAFLLISALHIILGELVPKSLAIGAAEKVCLFLAVPLRFFYLFFFPFLWVLNNLSNLVLRVIGFPRNQGPGRAHSEEELKLIVNDSYEDGAIAAGKKVLLDKALDFSHKTVQDVMIPVSRMVRLNLTESVHDNLIRAKEAGHTRFPLQVSDAEMKILGFVHMKDIIWHLEHGDVINLFDLRRPIIFFRQKLRLDHALIEFQNKKTHMAIVLDDKDEVLGLVTLENIIEQLVGQIEDEFDRKKK